MEHMPLISVIVPVYKVEAYLDKCISSIVNQTYSNMEIILVDDGSPDNCPAMCDAWAAKDSRIKVIHKENGGLSDARNAGMAVASGQYMGFVDSDDYIAPEMYQLLYDHMTENNCDISACGVEMVWEDGTPPRMLTKDGNCVLDSQSAMRAIIEETTLKQPVWYKLYKTALVRDILFPVSKYHEDVFWSYQAVGRANKVSVFDKPCYFYTQRAGSIMGERYSLKRLDAIEAKIARIEYVQQKFPELLGTAKRDLWGTCVYMGQMSFLHMDKDDRLSALKKLQAVCAQYPLTNEDKKSIPFKRYIWAVLSDISFIAVCKLRNWLKIGM